MMYVKNTGLKDSQTLGPNISYIIVLLFGFKYLLFYKLEVEIPTLSSCCEV